VEKQRPDAFAATTPAEGGAVDGPHTHQAGDLVADRYEIIRFLARGGMGEVYEARDRLVGSLVALKTIRDEHAKSPRAMERFRREIQLARQVTHPNVCRIFDVGAHDGRVFLSMELLPGDTLSKRLEAGPLSTDEALPIVEQIASALSAAHAAGVVHRDFKPQNVILAPRRAVVTDFGVARSAEDAEGPSLTGAGELVGTPAYMAPEQVSGKTITPATDIYALGVTIYEMVTGHLPFPGTVPLTVAAARLTDDPVPPEKHVPALDPRWSAAILRCLARDPAARPATPAEVLALLRGPAPLAKRGPVRRWLLVGGAVAALAVAAVTVKLSLGMSEHQSHTPEGREHFAKGEALYKDGRFQEAIDEFLAAYSLENAPELTFNIAQAYRLAGDRRKARFYYQIYLEKIPDSPVRAHAQEMVRMLDEQLSP
jgi:hypothetical protein